MDVFVTAITAGDLVLRFLGVCAAFSDDAKSLPARFNWDLEALKAVPVRSYFDAAREKRNNGELSPQRCQDPRKDFMLVLGRSAAQSQK